MAKLDEHPFIGGPLDGARLVTSVRSMPPVMIRVHMLTQDHDKPYSVAYYSQSYRGVQGGVEIGYAPAHPAEIEAFRNEVVEEGGSR